VLVLALSKVSIPPTISNVRNLGTERDTTKRYDQIDRCLEDLAILFFAYLTYLSSFQNYGVLKNLERSILLRLIVLRS